MNMRTNETDFWAKWLLAVSTGVALFGILLVILPGWTRQFFSLLLYGNTGYLDAFDVEALKYISLTHAVLGSCLAGWGIVLFILVKKMVHAHLKTVRMIVAVSVLCWFIPDTAFSLLYGFWPNAVLNSGFLVLFAIPLIALHKTER